jgi:hypothetical protein
MRYRLRALLIALAPAPPVLAGIAGARPESVPMTAAARAALAFAVAFRSDRGSNT